MRKLLPLICLMLLFSIGACTKAVYVPIESFRTDSIEIHTHDIDTLRMYDSVYVEKNGDTLREYKYKVIYRNTLKSDTLYKERVDTVRVPYPVEVAKSDGLLRRIKNHVAEILVLLVLFAVGAVYVKHKK